MNHINSTVSSLANYYAHLYMNYIVLCYVADSVKYLY